MIWLKIKGYENEYQLSSTGLLRRYIAGSRPTSVKSYHLPNGTQTVSLWKNGSRQCFMLHNLYAQTYQVPVETAKCILYGYHDGAEEAKETVRTWLREKIEECRQEIPEDASDNDEILYLRSFLRQLT